MKKSLPIERKSKRNPPTLKLADFWFDGGKPVLGWSTGENWNGWGVPLFDESQIEAAINALRVTGDLNCDFRSGDILEIWPFDDRDQISKHEAILFNGKRYWQLDGLTWNWEPITTDRERISRAANRERSGPRLSATSSKEDLHKWLEMRFEDWDREYDGGYTLDGLWAEVKSAAEASVGSPHVREATFRLPGWSVGYHDNIGAHAAIRELPGEENWIFVMTSDDREPRSLDDEATVGLYFFDGENWEQIAYQDFPDVRSAVKLKDAELQLLIEHALSMDEAQYLLIEEFEDWEQTDGEPSMMSWMATILKDAGVVDASGAAWPEARGAQRDAIEQIKNASPAQILDYMNERAEAING